jgi:hypothetical protein
VLARITSVVVGNGVACAVPPGDRDYLMFLMEGVEISRARRRGRHTWT